MINKLFCIARYWLLGQCECKERNERKIQLNYTFRYFESKSKWDGCGLRRRTNPSRTQHFIPYAHILPFGTFSVFYANLLCKLNWLENTNLIKRNKQRLLMPTMVDSSPVCIPFAFSLALFDFRAAERRNKIWIFSDISTTKHERCSNNCCSRSGSATEFKCFKCDQLHSVVFYYFRRDVSWFCPCGAILTSTWERSSAENFGRRQPNHKPISWLQR